MIIKCAWHMKNFGTELVIGEKPPYEDKRITHAMCPECYKKEMSKMPKKEPLYPHVPSKRQRESLDKEIKASKTREWTPMELLKRWHEVIGEMIIDNDIDLEKYPGIKELHNETFRVIRS